jgi:hypothetical protein
MVANTDPPLEIDVGGTGRHTRSMYTSGFSSKSHLLSFDSDSDTDPDTDHNPYRDRDAFVLY